MRIKKKDILDILKLTDDIIQTYGARLPGSDSCIKAANHIKDEFSKYCNKVFETNYKQHPKAFFYVPTILAITYLLGSILLISNMIFISLLVFIFGIVYLSSQFIFFGNVFDKLFETKPGKNVFGIINPSGAIRQQIIFSSHHDSPIICNFLKSNQKFYPFRLFIPITIYVLVFISTIIILINNGIPANSSIFIISLIIFGLIFVIPLFWYNSKEGSPGAGDNLLSSIISLKLSQLIKDNTKDLLNTRIIVLSNDGEEIGQKGVQAFIKQNRELLKEFPSFVINMDSIFKYEDLAILLSDRNGTIKLSENLADEVIDIANDLGYQIKKKKFPFGGGGTDAAHFSKEKVETISIIGISTELIRDDLIYHTANDVVENLDLNAIEAVMNILFNYIYYKDQKAINTV